MRSRVLLRLAARAADLGLPAGFGDVPVSTWIDRARLVARIDRARELGWGRS